MKNNLTIFKSGLLILLLSACSDEKEILPTLTFLSPANNSIVYNAFDVEASVEPPTITKMDLLINNLLVGFAEAAPYKFTINIDGYPAGNYTVKAIGYLNSGNTISNELQVTIAKPTLEKPLGLNVSKGTFGAKILINWSPVPSATSYEVYRLTNTNNSYQKIGLANGTSFEDTSIPSSLTQYFYKVRAFNSETIFSDYSEADYGYTSGKAYDLIRSFGQEGTAEHEFGFVPLISIDKNDILYLSDGTQANIKKYSVDGTFQGLLKSNVDSQAPIFFENKTVTSQGENLVIDENGNQKVSVATGLNIIGQMTFDTEGNIYFAVNHNSAEGYNHHRIYKYDTNGSYITSWGSKGTGESQLNEPWGVSFYNENIVVTCQLTKRAQFFSKTGQFLRSINLSNFSNILYGNFLKDDVLYIAAGSSILKTDLNGKIVEKIGEGVLTVATSVVVDSQGNIIVAEPYARKLHVFRKSL